MASIIMSDCMVLFGWRIVPLSGGVTQTSVYIDEVMRRQSAGSREHFRCRLFCWSWVENRPVRTGSRTVDCRRAGGGKVGRRPYGPQEREGERRAGSPGTP